MATVKAQPIRLVVPWELRFSAADKVREHPKEHPLIEGHYPDSVTLETVEPWSQDHQPSWAILTLWYSERSSGASELFPTFLARASDREILKSVMRKVNKLAESLGCYDPKRIPEAQIDIVVRKIDKLKQLAATNTAKEQGSSSNSDSAPNPKLTTSDFVAAPEAIHKTISELESESIGLPISGSKELTAMDTTIPSRWFRDAVEESKPTLKQAILKEFQCSNVVQPPATESLNSSGAESSPNSSSSSSPPSTLSNFWSNLKARWFRIFS